MIKVTFDGKGYDIAEGGSVLDALLSQGVELSYSCKSGTCQTCLVRAEDKAMVDPKWQAGLKPGDRALGYLLACQCRPVEDMALRSLSLSDSTIGAVIREKRRLNATVVALHLEPEAPLTVFPGQYVTLFLADGTGRSYSVANVPELDGYLELHVRRIPGGRMSGWIHDQATVGDRFMLRGPSGSCFYVNESNESFPILLAGTGTGLAPLFGILRDALRRGHKGAIHLVHGALRSDDLYCRDELRSLAADHPHIRYIPCVLDKDQAADDIAAGALDEVAITAIRDPKSTRAYFCGAPEMVALLKRKAFMAGLASRNIFSDAFLPTAPAQAPAG